LEVAVFVTHLLIIVSVKLKRSRYQELALDGLSEDSLAEALPYDQYSTDVLMQERFAPSTEATKLPLTQFSTRNAHLWLWSLLIAATVLCMLFV